MTSSPETCGMRSLRAMADVRHAERTMICVRNRRRCREGRGHCEANAVPDVRRRRAGFPERLRGSRGESFQKARENSRSLSVPHHGEMPSGVRRRPCDGASAPAAQVHLADAEDRLRACIWGRSDRMRSADVPRHRHDRIVDCRVERRGSRNRAPTFRPCSGAPAQDSPAFERSPRSALSGV